MTGPSASGRGRRATWLRRGLPVLLVALVAGLLVWALDGDGDPGSTAAPESSAAPSSDPGTVEPEATPTGSPAPITQASAAEVVAREGVPESARTVAATQVNFAVPSEWSDGASVRVVDAVQQVTEGRGPGELAGQPQTVFTLELTNGTGASLDLNGVVVQATYGSSATQAAPLYDDETTDFGGSLEPGATATAVYSFAVPEDQLGDVTLSVDVDGFRFPAVFTGAVPAR
ncbi:hypothetical protein [Blastococcus brunescens]|uniref:DUF4352 domain-containing protein n=1 Tax=Blastococcus brunescens TaxID=1564165 RepID=A0ABZ1B3J2_9ACTN|nr:hypothetical protein [Blastococcus sp. BMG 8361]WRL64731.1 hypothetical protein U6N30_02825 [Blastococcus sp. BMG 8361]